MRCIEQVPGAEIPTLRICVMPKPAVSYALSLSKALEMSLGIQETSCCLQVHLDVPAELECQRSVQTFDHYYGRAPSTL